jgi:predicted MFS family arabinose efflux permease
LLSLGLAQEKGEPNSLIYTLCFFVTAALFFALFLFRERKAPEPMIRLSMFKNLNFSTANMTHFFVGGALITALVTIPLMANTILGQSSLEGGLRLLRLTAAIPIGALCGGFLCRQFGYRLPTGLGLILSAVGFFFMSRWALDIADPQMTLHLLICGLGFGLVIAPIATAVIDSVKEERRGVAAALVIVMRMVGMIIGLSALTSWGMGRFHGMTAGMSLEHIITSPQELAESVLNLFHEFFLVGVGACLVGLLPAMWMKWKGQPAAN